MKKKKEIDINTLEITQSYKVPFAKNRELTNIKRNILESFMYTNKRLHNFISKENHSGLNYWKDIKKEDTTLIREYYESMFQEEENLRTAYAQNVYKHGNNKYKETIKSFFSDYGVKQRLIRKLKTGKRAKVFPKKPYFEDLLRFQLDYRMFGKQTLQKDDKGIYWFCLSNPFNEPYFENNKYIQEDQTKLSIENKEVEGKDKGKTQVKDLKNYRNQINIPLHGYQNIQHILDDIVEKSEKKKGNKYNNEDINKINNKGIRKDTFLNVKCVKYSFALGEDLNSLIINVEKTIQIKDNKNNLVSSDIGKNFNNPNYLENLENILPLLLETLGVSDISEIKNFQEIENQLFDILKKRVVGLDFGKYPSICSNDKLKKTGKETNINQDEPGKSESETNSKTKNSKSKKVGYVREQEIKSNPNIEKLGFNKFLEYNLKSFYNKVDKTRRKIKNLDKEISKKKKGEEFGCHL